MKATIYHNPECGTSRKTLEILREAGADVTVDRISEDPAVQGRAEAALRPRRPLRRARACRTKEQLRRPRPVAARSATMRSSRRWSEPDPDRAPAGRDRKGRPAVPAAGQGARNPVGLPGHGGRMKIDRGLQPEGRRRENHAGGQPRLGGRDPLGAADPALGPRPAVGGELPARRGARRQAQRRAGGVRQGRRSRQADPADRHRRGSTCFPPTPRCAGSTASCSASARRSGC